MNWHSIERLRWRQGATQRQATGKKRIYDDNNNNNNTQSHDYREIQSDLILKFVLPVEHLLIFISLLYLKKCNTANEHRLLIVLILAVTLDCQQPHCSMALWQSYCSK